MTLCGDSFLVERPGPPDGGGSIPASPLQIVPITQRQAKEFVARFHRHNQPSITSIFNVGLECEGEIVGVAMAGLPKARMLMDGRTLEVTRTCVRDGMMNANSMLYGACARAAAAFGWNQLITYTLASESGASLKAAGWKLDEGEFGRDGDDWAARYDRLPTDLFGRKRTPSGSKRRWRKIIQRRMTPTIPPSDLKTPNHTPRD
jgi:hypothetical protein